MCRKPDVGNLDVLDTALLQLGKLVQIDWPSTICRSKAAVEHTEVGAGKH